MLNKCCFIGNLGKDPEIRSTQAGKEIANLSLGVTEKWKAADGERKERTEWVRVTIFNEGLAGVAKQYLKKGSKLYIEGSMQTRKYTDNAGVEKYSTEIVLQGFDSKLIMLDGPQKGGEERVNKPEVRKPPASQHLVLDDEIPF